MVPNVFEVLCHASVGLAIAELSGKFRFVNESFAKLHHKTIQEFYDYDLMADPSPEVEGFKTIHREFVSGERDSYKADFQYADPSGQVKWFSVESTLVRDAAGLPESIVVVNHDITQRKLAEERAQQASRMKSTFLANMSHEIRTPLGAIMGFTELLGDGSLSQADRDEYLGIIARNSKSLSRIVDDVLDLSKVEAGLLKLEKIAFCPRTLLRDIVMLFSERARQKGLVIDLKLDREIPALLISDPMRIRQVINNLVSNSLKFTESGGVTINLSRGDSEVQIAVEDTGPGISQAHASTLFQAFVQGDESLSRKHGGTGLGLHLSKRLAEALGGALHFTETARHFGSRFEFHLPLVEPSVTELESWKNASGPKLFELRTHDLDGARILVVDDAADNRKLIERFLQRTGAHVDFAENGRSAVDQSSKDAFDLILMDLQMPDLDGFEATKLIREHEVETPIVALTAHAIESIRERCLSAGFSGFLAKPVDSAALMEAVRDLTKNRIRPQTPINHTH